MRTTFSQLKQQLNELQNIIVVHGEDAFLRRRAVGMIKESLGLEFEQFNLDTLTRAPMDEIITSASVLPFMTGARLVVAEDYHAPDGAEQREREKFKKYAQNPVYSTTLVFDVEICPGVIADLPQVDYVDCKKLPRGMTEKWITAYCRRQGKVISPYNARLISEFCLDDMTRISTETEKICCYSDGEITTEDVELMIEKDSELKLYEFANEIAVKNADKAFALAKGLLAKGNTPPALVSSVYRTFRRMFYSLVSSGMGQKEMASCLGVQPFAVAKAREIAEKFTQVKLRRALDVCAEADRNAKNGMNGNAVVNYLILRLISL